MLQRSFPPIAFASFPLPPCANLHLLSFPNDSAYWCSEYCGNMGNGLIEATDVLNGTTQINGQQYSRLQLPAVVQRRRLCVCAQIVQVDTATYYLRQDIPNKKIWLYDFGDQPGHPSFSTSTYKSVTRSMPERILGKGPFPGGSHPGHPHRLLPIAGQYRKRINHLLFRLHQLHGRRHRSGHTACFSRPIRTSIMPPRLTCSSCRTSPTSGLRDRHHRSGTILRRLHHGHSSTEQLELF